MTTANDGPPVSVHLLPGLIPDGALRGGAAVVLDVLRATTVMTHALAAGAESILPFAEVADAQRARDARPPGSVLLAGERAGLPIGGFDLGNSPGAFTPDRCRGKTLAMTTTNGTRAILASLEAELVLVAAFSNVSATLARLSRFRGEVHVVCAGTDGLVSFEDTALAGALVGGLAPARGPGNDGASVAAGFWRSLGVGLPPGATPSPEDLAERLARGRGGRRVFEIGLGPDVLEAARVDARPLVVELRRDPVRLVRAD